MDYSEYDYEIKEYKEYVENILYHLKSSKDQAMKCNDQQHFKDFMEFNGDLSAVVMNFMVTKNDIFSFKQRILDDLADEERMKIIRSFKDKYGDIEAEMRESVEIVDELDKLIDDLVNNIDKVVDKAIEEEKEELNSSRILDI